MTYEFLAMSQNVAFSSALMVVAILALIEGVGLAFGAGLSDVIGSIFPDTDVSIEGPDFADNSTLGAILAWLRVGQVPVVIILIVFLTAFGLTGLIIQQLLFGIIGWLMPWVVASIIAIILAMPVTRFLAGILQKILPRDETYAVSNNSFVGREANIVIGVAKQGFAAQAKLQDEHGKTHYIMLEPDMADVVFEQGETLLIVRVENDKFFAIKA